MKKIVRLTESELKNIVETSVRRAIKEGAVNEVNWKDVRNTAGAGFLGAAALTTGVGAGAFDDDPLVNDQPGAFPEDKAEFGDRLKPSNSIPSQDELPADTIGWKKANGIPESRIRRAVMESIMKLMNEQG